MLICYVSMSSYRINVGPTKTGSHPGAGAVITKTGSLRGSAYFLSRYILDQSKIFLTRSPLSNVTIRFLNFSSFEVLSIEISSKNRLLKRGLCGVGPFFSIIFSKNDPYRGNFMRGIDCAHSRILKTLSWPWFSGWRFLELVLNLNFPPNLDSGFGGKFKFKTNSKNRQPWIRVRKAFSRFGNARNRFPA